MTSSAYDLSGDSDDGVEILELQNAQNPNEQYDSDQDDDKDWVPKDVAAIGREAAIEVTSTKVKSMHSSVKVANNGAEWDITTPGIKEPHNDWPINAREMDELLKPKAVYWEFVKRIFDDPRLHLTSSFQQEKFTMSKATHPGVCQLWKQRFKEHAPNKSNVGSMYPTFIRSLIGEFILGWKVDYKWYDEDNRKIDLPVHQIVLDISKKKQAAALRNDVASTTVKKEKKKTNAAPNVAVHEAKKTVQPPMSARQPNHITITATPEEVNVRKRKHIDSDDNIHVEDTNNLNNYTADVCKSLGVEIGDLIATNLRTKYKMQLCESKTILEYKSKLQLAEEQIKKLKTTTPSSSSNTDVNMYKTLYEQGVEINKLKNDALAAKVTRLQDEIASQSTIISTLQDDLKNANKLAGEDKKEKGIGEDTPFFVMKIIDPAIHSSLYPDDKIVGDQTDTYFEELKQGDMASFVQAGEVCPWCQIPWGPESVSMLGTCGHAWHHACLGKWLKNSRKCWCRRPIHAREYEQRGLTVPVEASGFDTEFTEDSTQIGSGEPQLYDPQYDSMDISQFTSNEQNLTDTDWNGLLYSGRLSEWKEWAATVRPTVDEQNFNRSIRAHRRREGR